jgi:transposase
MNLYLKELSTNLKRLGKEAVVIMDGAGWHKSKDLEVPDNITIEILPPYCPELNPVERLWKYVKDHTIKNRVFNNLKDLEDTVCDFMRNLSCVEVVGICGRHERS